MTAENGHDPAADIVGLVDWNAFWKADASHLDWVVEPILPFGRQVVIWSKAKAGKSLLGLDMAAAVATGGPLLGQVNRAGPRSVLYLDWEMTEDDLRERLEDLGYGPETDLSHLHYVLAPSLPPLDSDLGGIAVEHYVEIFVPAVVIIDTTARAVIGEENSADTIRNFYRFTGRRLKASGATLCRFDHAGKNAALGQRGSSAKVDDVDVVWRLEVLGNRVELVRTHSRVSWVPERVVLQRDEEPLRHRLAPDSWPAGTADTAAALDQLGAPLDVSLRDAIVTLKGAGQGRRRQVVAGALRFRRGQDRAAPSPLDEDF